jgi:hypothetical protein
LNLTASQQFASASANKYADFLSPTLASDLMGLSNSTVTSLFYFMFGAKSFDLSKDLVRGIHFLLFKKSFFLVKQKIN